MHWRRTAGVTFLLAGLAGTAPVLAALDVEARGEPPATSLMLDAAAVGFRADATDASPLRVAAGAPGVDQRGRAAPTERAPVAGEASAGAAPPRRAYQLRAYDRLPQPSASQTEDADRVHVLLGLAANTSPNFFGGKSQDFKIKPVAALRWGRWRLSTGGGYGLMGQGRRDRGSGAQAVLQETDRFNLSLSLNIDRGRDVADTERLKGVPDVRATLRARVRARYSLTDRWTASLAASQDLLNRGCGLEIDGWLGYRWPLSEATRVDLGLGASWGNSQYMRSQFGIPQASVTASGYPAFRPRGGLYQTEIGIDLAHALSRAWVVFGGVRYSQLHGDARRSPLTLRSGGVSATVGIAWRN